MASPRSTGWSQAKFTQRISWASGVPVASPPGLLAALDHDDLLVHICSSLSVRELGRMACTASRFVRPTVGGASVVGAAARLAVESHARADCAPRRGDESWLRLARELELVDVPVFCRSSWEHECDDATLAELSTSWPDDGGGVNEAHGPGEVYYRLTDGATRLTIGGLNCLAHANVMTAAYMRAGKHRVEFEVSCRNADSGFGLGIGKAWCDPHAGPGRAEYFDWMDLKADRGSWIWENGWANEGNFTVDELDRSDCTWVGQEGFSPRPGDEKTVVVSMQLDVDGGTLTLFKGDRQLGTLPGDLNGQSDWEQRRIQPESSEWPTRINGGPFCWVAWVYAEGEGLKEASIRMRSVCPIEVRSDLRPQLGVTSLT